MSDGRSNPCTPWTSAGIRLIYNPGPCEGVHDLGMPPSLLD